MQAIHVRFLGPTDFRGARWKATAQAGSVIVPYDHAANHGGPDVAARALCDKLKWKGELVEGGMPDGSRVYVFAP